MLNLYVKPLRRLARERGQRPSKSSAILGLRVVSKHQVKNSRSYSPQWSALTPNAGNTITRLGKELGVFQVRTP